jgi:hypothetical protein
MPFSLVKRIVDEVSSDEFRKLHEITRFECGENGDAFLNPAIIDILRYIKTKLPKCEIEIFTNFQNLTKDKARIILEERLVDSIGTNIDGHDEYTFFNVKRIHLHSVRKNILDFLKIRKELNSDVRLSIYSITLSQYINTIKNNFGFYPIKMRKMDLKEVRDDFSLIQAQWRKLLDPRKDCITRIHRVYAWAERKRINIDSIDYRKYSCPLLDRIKHEAFIAPDGTWYACCYDSNYELVLGNVYDASIQQLFYGDKRLKLIKLLENKEFSKINGPCKTVNCCQSLHEKRILNILEELLPLHYLRDGDLGNLGWTLPSPGRLKRKLLKRA